MKILTVSDYVETSLYEHFKGRRFPGVNLILSCGDLPPEYLSFLVTAFSVPLYYVRGNHDLQYNEHKPAGCIDLHSKVILNHGLRFFGLEGSRWYNGKPLQYTEREMQKKIRKMHRKIKRLGGLDIVATHAPPRHIHDAEDQCHKGFKCFRQLIDQYAPRYFIHGHVHFNHTHDSQRITQINQTKIINSYGHYIFEIDTE